MTFNVLQNNYQNTAYFYVLCVQSKDGLLQQRTEMYSNPLESQT